MSNVIVYGQWVVLVISVAAIFMLGSKEDGWRSQGFIYTALARFLGGLIFLFTELWALAIANTIYVVLSIRGYLNNVSNEQQDKTTFWELWCKSIGHKAYDDDSKADKVAIIRTFWIVLHILTCLAIISNAIANHGWGLIGL